MIIHLTNEKIVDLMRNSSVFSNGCGVFETLLVVDSRIIYLERHLNRLNSSLQFFNVKGTVTKEMIDENLKQNPEYTVSKATSCVLKIIVYFDGETGFLQTQYIRDPYLNFNWNEGMKIKLLDSPVVSQNPLNFHKSINYLDKLYYSKQIKFLGFDEGVRINELGNMTEGLKTNLFIFNGNQWFTPPINDGILPGVARKWFIEVMVEKGYSVLEESITSKAFFESTLTVLTNSLIGCSLVNTKDSIKTSLAHEIISLNRDYRGGKYGTT
jgi:4-amino-4-deoxychorismate lyase